MPAVLEQMQPYILCSQALEALGSGRAAALADKLIQPQYHEA